MYIKKEEVLEKAKNLNNEKYPFEIKTEGNQIIAYWKWMDAIYFDMKHVTKEIQEYRYIVEVLNDGYYTYMDADSSMEGTLGVDGASFGAEGFYGRKISYNSTVVLGKDEQTGKIGLQKYTYSTAQIHKLMKDYMQQSGYKVLHAENFIEVKGDASKPIDIFNKFWKIFGIIAIVIFIAIYFINSKTATEFEKKMIFPLTYGSILTFATWEITLRVYGFYKKKHMGAVITALLNTIGVAILTAAIIISVNVKMTEEYLKTGKAYYKTGTIVGFEEYKNSNGESRTKAVYVIQDGKDKFEQKEFKNGNMKIGDTKEFVVIRENNENAKVTNVPNHIISKIIVAIAIITIVIPNVVYLNKKRKLKRILNK